eukprot:SAG22_NODE_19704_length_272_cov_0.884393_1_plen_46_part_10
MPRQTAAAAQPEPDLESQAGGTLPVDRLPIDLDSAGGGGDGGDPEG